MAQANELPLSALLSQVLVAYTIEFDNEFERQMGTNLSLVVWSNLMRFLGPSGASVKELADRALAPIDRIKVELGCLERWGIIALQSGKRDGWGSARGIKNDWIVRPTPRGQRAIEIWPPLFAWVGTRWYSRFGAVTIDPLRGALQTIADQIEYELPQALPGPVLPGKAETYPARSSKPVELNLAALFAQVLLAFRIEFDRESPTALALCANTIRVLSSDQSVREADLPMLTGTSTEVCGPGWQLKPYILVEPDPTARRGKVLRLTPLGLSAQHTYIRLAAAIETRWNSRFGEDIIRALRESLIALFPSIAEGLVPPAGVVRSGTIPPALGRRDIGAAARKRARDLITQTEAFLRDPAATLPHYPLWDMNRGFGP